jgi:uncharacterized protein with PhoU and TrkA domain
VDVALNSSDVLAHLIQEEMSLGDMMTLFKIRRGRYSVVEEKVPAGAKAIGIQLKDMDLAEHCVIAAIIRDGVMTLPRGDSTLQEDDEIIAVASPKACKGSRNCSPSPSTPSGMEENRLSLELTESKSLRYNSVPCHTDAGAELCNYF